MPPPEPRMGWLTEHDPSASDHSKLTCWALVVYQMQPCCQQLQSPQALQWSPTAQGKLLQPALGIARPAGSFGYLHSNLLQRDLAAAVLDVSRPSVRSSEDNIENPSWLLCIGSGRWNSLPFNKLVTASQRQS